MILAADFFFNPSFIHSGLFLANFATAFFVYLSRINASFPFGEHQIAIHNLLFV